MTEPRQSSAATSHATCPNTPAASSSAGSTPTTFSAATSTLYFSANEIDRVKAAIAAARAPSTRTLYACLWRQWERWCDQRGVPGLPGDPEALCVYLTERVSQGLSATSLGVTCAAIRYVHRTHGQPDPTATEIVGQVCSGLRRTHGAAPRRQARPLSTDDIRTILSGIDRGTAKGARDAALILIGFASALRRSELAALTLADITTKPAGLLLRIVQSKTDQTRAGAVVPVSHGTHLDTDPVAAWQTWQVRRGSDPGPAFTQVRGNSATGDPISGRTVARMLRRRAENVDLDATRITGHSLRAGHATTAALAGVSLDRIAAQTRHRDLDTLVDRYIRPLDLLNSTSSRDLGL